MPRHDNIFLVDTATTINYKSTLKPRKKMVIPQREDRALHSKILISQYQVAQREFENYIPKTVLAKKYNTGTYVEFSSAENYELLTKSLEDSRQGIRLLNVRDILSKDETGANKVVTKATVFIPAGKEKVFIKKISDYATQQSRSGKPKNNDLVSSIESISNALKISAFWIGKPTDMPAEDENWYELWVDVQEEALDQTRALVFSVLDEFNVQYKKDTIHFPERLIVLAFVNCSKILDILSHGVTLAEIRKPANPNGFFLESSFEEQTQWADDLLARTNYYNSGVAVCILDTGVNGNHKLIAPYMHTPGMTVINSWGIDDQDGHGTNMAGVVLYNDLKRYLIDTGTVDINHSVESVKILPPNGRNPVSLYGAITEQAVLLSDISNPTNKRVYCMAITDPQSGSNNGLPSSWSSAIDEIVSKGEKRLFLVSAGNNNIVSLQINGYPRSCELESVQDPAQAWNALSIGAFSQDNAIQLTPTTRGYQAVAKFEELSPYSTSSVLWGNQWPIKPELLCDGGNVATDGTNYADGLDDLSKLTLSKDISNKLFDTIWATSAATAQCAYIAAELYAAYPKVWPETVRGLLIHSARWTDAMKQQFGIPDNKTQGRKKLLRTCGYGIPSLERAKDTLNNRVNMIIESELQPFEKDSSASKKMKEMHLHLIPWPKEVLQSLENTEMDVRITLSYYVEPGPGEKGWKNKYRYASCGLRFDIKKPNESLEQFKSRINSAMRDEDYLNTSTGSNNWFLGPKNRDVGSIHSDVWRDSAINLSESEYIAVFPVVGWWRERANLKRTNSKIRYSLIVSIETPMENVDLYTPIMTKIANRISVPIATNRNNQ